MSVMTPIRFLSPVSCLQQIDSLIYGNLADIVVELLMTLYEGAESDTAEREDLHQFIG